jgi:pimeloyl-ACP methyl ester carboxylesterase
VSRPLREEVVTVPTGLEVRVFRGGPAGPTGEEHSGNTAVDAPRLVWFHPANGITADDPVAGALAERFDVYAPLAPGFHEIAELDDIRDVHELAMFYDDLFGVLGLEDVACVGHSFGGMVAAELAAHYPSRVSKLVLVAPVGLWDPAHPTLDIFATPPVELAELVWGDPASEAAQAARAASGAGVSMAERAALMKDELYVEGMVKLVMGFTAVAKFLWPLPDKGLARRCYRIAADTLLIWGAKDRLAPPDYAADFARLLPRSRVEMLDDAGHMVTLERLDDVVSLIAGHCGATR